MRFVRGDQSIRLDMADRLAAYLGLELRKGLTRPGQVFKKTVTRPSVGVEIIVRRGKLARWRMAREAGDGPADRAEGAERIRDESNTYFARFRDGSGVVVDGDRVPDGRRPSSARRSGAGPSERAGLLSPAEARTSVHLIKPIGARQRLHRVDEARGVVVITGRTPVGTWNASSGMRVDRHAT
ncbi:MAG: hypothetical protein WKF75_06870 [Singulisphaera sp.]